MCTVNCTENKGLKISTTLVYTCRLLNPGLPMRSLVATGLTHRETAAFVSGFITTFSRRASGFHR